MQERRTSFVRLFLLIAELLILINAVTQQVVGELPPLGPHELRLTCFHATLSSRIT